MLNAVQLSGDFFLMPPEKLPDLERFLTGWKLDAPGGAEQLAGRIQKFLQRERIELAGVDAAGFAHVIYLAAAPAENASTSREGSS
jgi:hypothetical protein